MFQASFAEHSHNTYCFSCTTAFSETELIFPKEFFGFCRPSISFQIKGWLARRSSLKPRCQPSTACEWQNNGSLRPPRLVGRPIQVSSKYLTRSRISSSFSSKNVESRNCSNSVHLQIVFD